MWYMVLCTMWRVFTVSSTGRPLWRPGTGPHAARCRWYTCRHVLPDLGSCRICTYSSLEIQIFHHDCKMKFGSGLGVSLCVTRDHSSIPKKSMVGSTFLLCRCLLLQCMHNLQNTTHTNSIARLWFWLKSETWFCTNLLTSATPMCLSRTFSLSWSQWGLVWMGSVPHSSSSARASLETLVSWGNVASWPTCTRQGVTICDMQVTNHSFEQY